MLKTLPETYTSFFSVCHALLHKFFFLYKLLAPNRTGADLAS